MSLECFTSVVERQKPMANRLNKPKQNVSYVRHTLLETTIERSFGKQCS